MQQSKHLVALECIIFRFVAAFGGDRGREYEIDNNMLNLYIIYLFLQIHDALPQCHEIRIGRTITHFYRKVLNCHYGDFPLFLNFGVV